MFGYDSPAEDCMGFSTSPVVRLHVEQGEDGLAGRSGMREVRVWSAEGINAGRFMRKAATEHLCAAP